MNAIKANAALRASEMAEGRADDASGDSFQHSKMVAEGEATRALVYAVLAVAEEIKALRESMQYVGR